MCVASQSFALACIRMPCTRDFWTGLNLLMCGLFVLLKLVLEG